MTFDSSISRHPWQSHINAKFIQYKSTSAGNAWHIGKLSLLSIYIADHQVDLATSLCEND